MRIGAINVNDLLAAQEVFITNSIMRVMPVSRIEQHQVGEQTPGPVARTLMSLHEEALA